MEALATIALLFGLSCFCAGWFCRRDYERIKRRKPSLGDAVLSKGWAVLRSKRL